jgi:ATP-dependent DNA ligase
LFKHDGYRMLAHRDGERVRLLSRRGVDWGDRLPTIVAAVEALAVHTCTIDGELIACDANGDPVIAFRVRSDRIRRPRSAV